MAAVAVLLAGGCSDPPPTPPPTVLLPTGYATALTRVRACRGTTEHSDPVGGVHGLAAAGIVVYVSPGAVDAYQNNRSPLPADTVVVKEEYDSADCQRLIAWSVMRKEPGYDPSHGDWHWQHLLADRTMDADGRVTRCIHCHQTEPASTVTHLTCVQRDWMCTDP